MHYEDLPSDENGSLIAEEVGFPVEISIPHFVKVDRSWTSVIP